MEPIQQNQTTEIDVTEIRAISDARQKLQKMRIQNGNRLEAYKALMTDEQLDKLKEKPFFIDLFEAFTILEKKADKRIEKEMRKHNMWNTVTSVRGLGPILAARLLLNIDIHRAKNAGSLVKYAGYAVNRTTNKADGKVKGEKLCYNQDLKVTVYLIVCSFIKVANCPYRQDYDNAKLRYEELYPDKPSDPKLVDPNKVYKTKAHRHQMAIRKVARLFLCHLHQVWSEKEGLEVRLPYALEHLGHNTFISPQERGWPEIEK
jgi:hypothetical protein